MLNNTSHKPCK